MQSPCSIVQSEAGPAPQITAPSPQSGKGSPGPSDQLESRFHCCYAADSSCPAPVLWCLYVSGSAPILRADAAFAAVVRGRAPGRKSGHLPSPVEPTQHCAEGPVPPTTPQRFRPQFAVGLVRGLWATQWPCAVRRGVLGGHRGLGTQTMAVGPGGLAGRARGFLSCLPGCALPSRHSRRLGHWGSVVGPVCPFQPCRSHAAAPLALCSGCGGCGAALRCTGGRTFGGRLVAISGLSFLLLCDVGNVGHTGRALAVQGAPPGRGS